MTTQALTNLYPITVPHTTSLSIDTEVKEWAAKLPSVEDTDELRSKIQQWGCPWFRAGALIRNIEGKFLMVHEARVQIKKIKDSELRAKAIQEILQKSPECKNLENEWVDGDGGWNIPAGRLSLGESFEFAAERETMEESGCVIHLEQRLYTRYSDKVKDPFIMPVYSAFALWAPTQFRTPEVLEIAWFTGDEIRALRDCDKLRSPKSVMGALTAFEALQG